MDKSKAMKVMAESHRETVKELEKEYNKNLEDSHIETLNLEIKNKRYREAITRIKETRYIAVSLTSHLDLIYEVIKELEGDSHE